MGAVRFLYLAGEARCTVHMLHLEFHGSDTVGIGSISSLAL